VPSEAMPSAEGALEEHDFPDLIQTLYKSRWSGSLTVTQGNAAKSVIVDEGRLVFASSTVVDDRLGELLLRTGRLTLRQFQDAGNMVGPGRRLGSILVEQGLLTPKDLIKVVVEHTQEIIYSLFLWTSGQYRMRAGREAASEAITLKISTPAVIMEGIYRIGAWSRIRRAVGGLDARYRRSDDYENVIAQMGLSFEKLSLLTSLNDTRTVEQICANSTLSDFEVCRCLWAFRVIGVTQSVDVTASPSVSIEDEGLGMLLEGVNQ
jgi:hypothetical protein